MSDNSTFRYANELLFALEYFSEQNIDLTSRVASGELISYREYMSFYERCCFGKGYKAKSSNIQLRYFSDKQLRNVMVANQAKSSSVASETIQGRIRRLRQYIEWLFHQFHDSFNVNSEIDSRRKKLLSKIKLDEQGLRKNNNRVAFGLDDSVMPDKLFSELLEMVVPGSPTNPFKISQVRNYLIVSLLIQCGIRRGALAKLKISDLLYCGTLDQIKIYRSGNDPQDSRAEKPNHKSKPHFATISPSLMKEIKNYVDNVRVQYPSSSHDYIFISESDTKKTTGAPLSVKSINAIFRKLSKSIGCHIHPHLLRHKWNEHFSEAGAKKEIDSALLEDIRRYAMGWSHDSSMSRIYNDKSVARKARELSLIHQKKMDRSDVN